MKGIFSYITVGLFAAILFMGSSAFAFDIAVISARQDSRTEELTRKDLERIFMKRKTLWADGSAIVPVNLPVRSEIREYFSKKSLRGATGSWSTTGTPPTLWVRLRQGCS